MTVNERLYVAGLMDRWDKAKERKDANEMASLLSTVGLPPENASWTAGEVLRRHELEQRRKKLNAMSLADVARVYVNQFDGAQPDLSGGKANLIERIIGDLRTYS